MSGPTSGPRPGSGRYAMFAPRSCRERLSVQSSGDPILRQRTHGGEEHQAMGDDDERSGKAGGGTGSRSVGVSYGYSVSSSSGDRTETTSHIEHWAGDPAAFRRLHLKRALLTEVHRLTGLGER